MGHYAQVWGYGPFHYLAQGGAETCPQVHAVNPVSSKEDTIAAIATPPGRGGIGIVRISGPRVQAVASALLSRLPSPRIALFTAFLGSDREPLDDGIALFFPAPHSFTGEDVLELQGHGGPVVMDMLLQRVLSLGIRLARPGEFTERAFLNGKLDLAQAEAVADLITSTTQQAARSALIRFLNPLPFPCDSFRTAVDLSL
jgi:tRNA modification GTPase